jgi:iron complex outermembrane recepter protein
MNNYKIHPLALFTSIAGASLVGLPAAAAPMLEEVLVTAQKREESLMDVPISILAVSGEKISNAGINDLSELSAYVPNLTITEGTINTNIFMRGVGSGNNRAFEQSVGMFIDGIYMGRSRQFRAPFFDLERVEVLRGPQGILFGKNTIAGAINLTTAKPHVGEEFNGSVSVEYEPEYGTETGMAIISGDVTDTLAMRLAYKHRSSDGWVENTGLNSDGPETKENTLRLAFSWEPSSDWQIDGKFEQSEFESEGLAVQPVFSEPVGGLANFVAAASLANDPTFETKPNDRKSTDGILSDDSRDTTVKNGALNIDYALGDHTLSLVSGYSYYEYQDTLDADFAPISFLSTIDDSDFTQWSQEIRLSSPGGEKFDYITGVFWQKNELAADSDNDVDVLTDLGPFFDATYDFLKGLGVIPPFVNPTNFSRDNRFEQDTETWSAFFQGTLSLTNDVRLIAGARYTHETKEFNRQGKFAEFQDNDTPAGLDASVTAALLGLEVPVADYDEKRTENHFTPSMKIQWDVNDSIMTYALVEKGFKSGGFNSNIDTSLESAQFDEEEALSYEAGLKSTVADGRGEINLAIFRTEYDDLQVSSWNGISFDVGNAAESIAQGVELDGRFALTDNLTVGGSIAYLDSTYSDFEDGPCAVSVAAEDQPCDLTDRPTQFASDWTSNLFVDYNMPLDNGMEFRAGIDINYTDDMFLDTDLDENLTQDAYTKVNARIALAGTDNVWEVTLIGKNLTDKTTLGTGYDQPLVAGGYVAFVEAPREISVRLKVSF